MHPDHHNQEHLLVDHKIAAILKKLGLAKDEVKPQKEALLVDQKVAELLKGLNLAQDEYPKYHQALKAYLLA
jgi:hypothetical protein